MPFTFLGYFLKCLKHFVANSKVTASEKCNKYCVTETVNTFRDLFLSLAKKKNKLISKSSQLQIYTEL